MPSRIPQIGDFFDIHGTNRMETHGHARSPIPGRSTAQESSKPRWPGAGVQPTPGCSLDRKPCTSVSLQASGNRAEMDCDRPRRRDIICADSNAFVSSIPELDAPGISAYAIRDGLAIPITILESTKIPISVLFTVERCKPSFTIVPFRNQPRTHRSMTPQTRRVHVKPCAEHACSCVGKIIQYGWSS